jgi:hypothetical protein
MIQPGLCEETTGFPCEDGGELELPEGEATIIGTLDGQTAAESGSIIKYTDPDGEVWVHEMTENHQLLAIGDAFGNTALVIIGPNLSYTEQGIIG